MAEEATDPGPRKGMRTGAKVGIGCGIGCLVVVILLAVGGFIVFKKVKSKIGQVKSELIELGFENVVRGQMLEVRDPITEHTLYMGQVVKIMSDSTGDVAVMAQSCEVHGKIKGKLYFRGQVLVVQPQAEIADGLDVIAQMIQNYGKIEGGITGTYQALQDESVQNAK